MMRAITADFYCERIGVFLPLITTFSWRRGNTLTFKHKTWLDQSQTLPSGGVSLYQESLEIRPHWNTNVSSDFSLAAFYWTNDKSWTKNKSPHSMVQEYAVPYNAVIIVINSKVNTCCFLSQRNMLYSFFDEIFRRICSFYVLFYSIAMNRMQLSLSILAHV